LSEHRRVWLGRAVVLNVPQEHRLHRVMGFIVISFSSGIPSGRGHKL
jgi:hypothetical protein